MEREGEVTKGKGKMDASGADESTRQAMKVVVDNWRDGDVVGYPLLRLTGRINGTSEEGAVFVSSAPTRSAYNKGPATVDLGAALDFAFKSAQTSDPGVEVVDEVEDSEFSAAEAEWTVVDGRFKGLALLQRGDNIVRLRYVGSTGSGALGFIRIHYEPLLIQNRFARSPGAVVPSPTTILPATTSDEAGGRAEGAGTEGWRRFVRLIYLIARDDLIDRGDQGSALAGSQLQANLERMALGALMLQSFCADNMDEDGGALFAHGALPFPPGRATFGLEFADDQPACNWPIVHVMRSRLTREQIYRLGNDWKDGGQGAWSHFASELKHLPHRSNSIDCVIMGMTQYNPSTGKCSAHTALGGGQMALFGSGGLHTWPRTLKDVRACWMDASRVDKTQFFDDSGGRGSMWANFATTLGATLHEIGHCFGLDHTEHGIMLRGFDNINRWAMVEEAGYMPRPILKRHEGGAHWHAESIRLLARSPYFYPASLSTILVRLLNDHPSAKQPKRTSRFEPGVRLQVIPVYRPPKHIRTAHIRWEKAEAAQYFQKSDQPLTNVWVEVHDTEVFCRFVEVLYSAEEGLVILFDINRNLLVKIQRDECFWATVDASGAQPEWNSLGGGRWKDDHFTGQH